MKKNLCIIFTFACLLICMPANAAQSVKVSALTPFNSLMPSDSMKVMVLEKTVFKNGLIFEDGTVINGNVIDVKQPKRAKLNASFKFQPISYIYNGKTTKIEDIEFVAKYSEYKELDKAGLATSAATTAGGMLFHIPLLSEGVSMLKGMYKNPENNRLKSGVVQVYKDSPLSYVEEGKDIVINKDQMFILKFKTSKNEDLDTAPANNVTKIEDQNITATPEQVQNSFQVNTINTPIPVQTQIKTIKTSSPDDVLKEVELNTK